MATYTATVSDFSISSTWTVTVNSPFMTTPTTGSSTQTFYFSGITAGSTINSATLYATLGSPWTGAAVRSADNVAFNGTLAVSGVSGGGSKSITFRFKANGTTSTTLGSHTSSLSFSSVRIVVTYTLPYTACGAPTSVTIPTNVLPSTNQTLSWSGAKAGTNNAITGYQVYRASTSNGTYTALGSKINSSSTSGSVSVTSNKTVGSSYYYKVLTYGTVSGYNSEKSSSYATMKTLISKVIAPTSMIATPAFFDGDTVLSWSGQANGTNNNITKYLIEWQKSPDKATWGTATADETATASYTISSDLVSRGEYIRYRIKVIGTVSGYDADWTAYTTATFKRNLLPLAPTINYGVTGTTIYNTKPYFSVSYPAEPDGQTQKLQISLDSTNYANIASLPAAAGTHKFRLTSALSTGANTISFRMMDDSGAVSSSVSTTITVATPSFTDTVEAGVPVKAIHVTELRAMVDNIRQYYGIAAISWLDAVARGVVIKAVHFTQLQDALRACATSAGVTLVLTTVSANQWIAATIINQLRYSIDLV